MERAASRALARVSARHRTDDATDGALTLTTDDALAGALSDAGATKADLALYERVSKIRDLAERREPADAGALSTRLVAPPRPLGPARFVAMLETIAEDLAIFMMTFSIPIVLIGLMLPFVGVYLVLATLFLAIGALAIPKRRIELMRHGLFTSARPGDIPSTFLLTDDAGNTHTHYASNNAESVSDDPRALVLLDDDGAITDALVLGTTKYVTLRDDGRLETTPRGRKMFALFVFWLLFAFGPALIRVLFRLVA